MVFHHLFSTVVRPLSQSLSACPCMCVANKEEVVPKARPVSSDVGSSNPNFSDLMDEFIQERLRARGTVVSTTLCFILFKGLKRLTLFLAMTIRVVVAAALEVWRFPETCQSSWKLARHPSHGPRMISGLLMIPGFPLSGLHLQVPVDLMVSAQTASRTPLMPFNMQPASLTVRTKQIH